MLRPEGCCVQDPVAQLVRPGPVPDAPSLEGAFTVELGQSWCELSLAGGLSSFPGSCCGPCAQRGQSRPGLGTPGQQEGAALRVLPGKARALGVLLEEALQCVLPLKVLGTPVLFLASAMPACWAAVCEAHPCPPVVGEAFSEEGGLWTLPAQRVQIEGLTVSFPHAGSPSR